MMPIDIWIYTLFLFVSVLFANVKVKVFSFKPSPLGLFLAVVVFIQIVPAIYLISFFDAPMIFGVERLISTSTFDLTFKMTVVSLVILFLGLGFICQILNIDFDFKKTPVCKMHMYILTLISLIVVCIKLATVKDIPLLYALKGQGAIAAQMKADILTGTSGAGGFLIGYFFKYGPLLSFSYSVFYRYISTDKRAKLLLFINAIILFVYQTYDLRKSGLIIMFMVLYLVGVRLSKSKSYALLPIIAISSIIPGFILLNDADLGSAVQMLIHRMFLGQMDGSYMIYETITPSLNYAFLGMPMAGILGVSVSDPAAEVVAFFFPTAGEAWVNSNTYFLAHAWSIFGNSAVIVAPLVFCLNIVVLHILRVYSKRYISGAADVLFIVVIMTMPFNNNFTSFLYFKPALGFMIMVLLLLVVFSFCNFLVKGEKD